MPTSPANVSWVTTVWISAVKAGNDLYDAERHWVLVTESETVNVRWVVDGADGAIRGLPGVVLNRFDISRWELIAARVSFFVKYGSMIGP